MKQIILLSVIYLITIKKLTLAKYLVIVNEDDLIRRKGRDVGPSAFDELVKAGAQVAYIKSYDDGSDGGNERGYFKAAEDKGSSGYKHYDSFHKKDGDKYGYETHSEFGKASGAENEAKGSKYKHDDDDYEKADEQFKDKQLEEKETKNAYKVVE
ncbi:hypothetical protein FQR65_LT07094 [Abscondita terminalis]|nr:hypothetical protein FQR65_LT07094 [Abscondita terminalis]